MINYVEREHTNPDGTVVRILCHPDFNIAGIGAEVMIGSGVDPAQPVDETDR